MSDTNAIKVFAARNGTIITMDDERQIIRLQTGDSYLELRGDGDIVINGKKIKLDAEAAASILAGQEIEIDAQRINLG